MTMMTTTRRTMTTFEWRMFCKCFNGISCIILSIAIFRRIIIIGISCIISIIAAIRRIVINGITQDPVFCSGPSLACHAAGTTIALSSKACGHSGTAPTK